jgi:hypothetical protein
MSFDNPPIPPAEEPKKKNKLLWGCLIALVLILVTICCGTSLVFMPLFTDYDPLGTGLRDRIEEYLPLDYLEEPSSVPSYEDLLNEEPFTEEEDYIPETTSEEITEAEDIPLAIFNFVDIYTSFYYPVGWDIEMEGYAVTFYEPNSFTYIYLGEDLTDPGNTAESIALEIMDSIEADAQEDTFNTITSDPYYVSIAEDAYLTLFEWIDADGYYTWAYDLEIVSGESNIFIFLSGEDPDEILFYGNLLDIIASSLEIMPEIEESEDI